MRRLGILWALVILCASLATGAAEPALVLRFEGISPRDESLAQFELISSEGSRVLINVYDPQLLSAPATADDILLTTQPMKDEFSASFPGRQLMAEAGEIKRNGVSIVGIPSVHLYNQQPQPKNGSNYIYLIEIAGLRVADFGGIGQNELTPEQLKAIGNVDIALAPLFCVDNRTNIDNLRGFNLMNQVQPKILIPTGVDLDTAKYAVELWKGNYVEGPEFTLTRGKLPAKTQLLFLGPKAKMYGKACKLQPAS